MDFMVSPGWKQVIYNSGPNRENFGALLNNIIGQGLICKSVSFFLYFYFTLPTHTPYLLILAACDCYIKITCYYLTALIE